MLSYGLASERDIGTSRAAGLLIASVGKAMRVEAFIAM